MIRLHEVRIGIVGRQYRVAKKPASACGTRLPSDQGRAGGGSSDRYRYRAFDNFVASARFRFRSSKSQKKSIFTIFSNKKSYILTMIHFLTNFVIYNTIFV